MSLTSRRLFKNYLANISTIFSGLILINLTNFHVFCTHSSHVLAYYFIYFILFLVVIQDPFDNSIPNTDGFFIMLKYSLLLLLLCEGKACHNSTL